MTKHPTDTLIELALFPLLPLAFVVWLRWRRHEREMLLRWTDCDRDDTPEYTCPTAWRSAGDPGDGAGEPE